MNRDETRIPEIILLCLFRSKLYPETTLIPLIKIFLQSGINLSI